MHNVNLALYTAKRAAIARAAGDTEKAERLERAVAHWLEMAAR